MTEATAIDRSAGSIVFRVGTFQPTRKSDSLDKGHVRNGECGKPHKNNLHDTRVQRGPG